MMKFFYIQEVISLTIKDFLLFNKDLILKEFLIFKEKKNIEGKQNFKALNFQISVLNHHF